MRRFMMVIPLLLLAILEIQTAPSIELSSKQPRLVRRELIDPPTNPLHFIKITSDRQIPPKQSLASLNLSQAEHSEGLKVSRWNVYEPGYYTDAFARNLMFPLAAAAYTDDPSVCLRNKFRNATLSKYVLSKCENKDMMELCAGFTALLHNEKAIVVSFRGTEQLFQLIAEFHQVILKKKHPSPVGGFIAYYFYTVFQQLWSKGLQADIEVLMSTFPDYEIWVTGHSLGGSVASIAATWILNKYNLDSDRIKLVTFGQPRTGDTEYAVAHNLRLPHSYRITHGHDMIPHLPPEKFEGYFHHSSEIWYPKEMTDGAEFVVCKSGESRECSMKQWLDLSITDHLHYFGKYVSYYGTMGCVD